ncbi:hypothetical protein P9G84_31910 [Brevibacillus centrosporus]|uniref:hypothetical protein n=1 Tax=Brevibacillus centrosporus TaxID=54910 RepID=UPI000F09AD5A|nr:hypothetical protein [Brevibacillus centrosporus]MEC2133458.1 hypothetical protein [Brevibacillus centrosporus]RNB63175.1 hypothetical protein EDM55_29370 [Brevibacillus centrosporus]GED35003.1 hypothetical protein BCE02nite_61440 [Brevibacillus centrosporus]
MGTERIITTVKSTTRLFKQPHKIGDVIEIRDKSYLILGIERFKLYGHELTIWFTCQDLTKTDFLSMNKAYKQQHAVEAFVKAKHDNERLRLYELGTVHYIEGQAYKIQEYTEILIKGTDIEISFTVRPIYPIDRKEAKAKLFSERRKKLQLEIL